MLGVFVWFFFSSKLSLSYSFHSCVSIEDSTSVILKPPQNSLSRLSEKTAGQKFTFSQVFAPETTQEEFFEGTMKQPVQDFLDGYNRLIFTYGVTNAGKTYTFQGTEDDIGILPRTMDMLFKSIQGRLYTAMDFKPHRCRDYIRLTRDQVKEETAIKNSILHLTKENDSLILFYFTRSLLTCNILYLTDLEELLKGSEQSSTTVKNHVKFSLWVSFCEIYNECFYDLLIPMSNDKKRKTLRLAQDIKGCSYVKDLQWVQISDSKEAFRLLKLGLKHQSITSKKLNTFSSRSHSIFTVKILKIEDSGAPQVTRVNELSMCDLAGSERYAKTHNEGHRLKESGNINTSLLILGKCINALKNSQQSKLQQHIPFRESKLTHFLQGFFSGKGRVYMIVNISQCASTYDETLNVLKFSAIAQKVSVLAMDTSVLVQDQSFDQKSTTSSLLNHPKMPISRKRVTVLWDRSLEDVIEDDNEMEEQHMSREEAVQKNEDNKVLIGKKEYMVCARGMLGISVMLLNLIEELKNKLITEKKSKLLLELKIREEVTQEFAKYFAEQEIDFNEFLSCERERLQEDSDRRLEIFKELVNGYLEDMDEENQPKDKPCSEQAGPLESQEDDSLDQKRTEYVKTNNTENYAEILALKERTENLEGQLAALEEQCRREKNKKEEFSGQIKNLNLKLSASEERATGLGEELQQCRADYQEIVSELDKQKTINREQEEKIIQLNNEVEGAKQNIIYKVSLIKTMQSKVDELYKCHLESYAMDIDSVNLKDSLDSQKLERAQVSPICTESQTASTADLRQENFHCSVESIWEECKNIIKASSQKSQQIQELLQQVEDLKKGLDDAENYNNQLKIKLNETANQDHQSTKEKDLMNQLQEHIQKKTQDFEKQAAEDHRIIAQFEEEVTSYKGKIRELECLLEAFRAKDGSITKLEEVLKEKESIISNLESNTIALQKECANSNKKLKELNDQKASLKDEVVQLMNSLENMKHTLQDKEKNEYEQIQSIELLRKDLSESSTLVQSLKKDVQRKEEEYADLREKFSDAKKQIQQVQKEVCAMQSEEKSLRNKVNELQKIKNQLSEELEIKQRTILLFKKEQLNNEKLEEVSKQYEKACKDLCAKEKIIEDMRMTLEEQEQTQIKQDQVIEAKLEETNRLVRELEAWKQKYRELNNQSNGDWQQKMSKTTEKNIDENEELVKLQKELKENEAKYQTDRKNWMEEKMRLMSEVKEAECHRNREMRKFAEDRKRCVEQQAEIERLAAQLVEKDSNLQKWREERDKLIEALEVQLKTLVSNTIQKDKEIAELKQAAVKDSGKVLSHSFSYRNVNFFKCNKTDHSEIVLDSLEVSTENGNTSRFPKPEMEIQFTPLQPDKMEVKHQGSTLPVTVKVLKPRKKRKSEEMDEMSSTQVFRKEYSLRKQESTSSKKSAKKKDGTLQKIGDFFQSSPVIIHSKAKKLMATISSPKSAEPENVKGNELKPKRAKRKLYSTDISFPLDIPDSSTQSWESQKAKEI
uniref:Kinesin family member 20B n=1 Tax=Otus sunia TaxID=257818 RepID=A0A8C8AER4_9STRI